MNQKDLNTKNTDSSMQTQFNDVSRFTRWVNRMDQKDESLNPQKRKRKWFFVLAGLLSFYLLSFLIPMPELKHQPIESKEMVNTQPTDSVKNSSKQKSMTFEMSVDSFETVLKSRINEKLPEKK